MSVFEAVRDQVDVAQLAGRYTQLSRAGKLLRGRCPVHDDSTPSFFVYPDDHFYCFGCTAGGDVVDLWADIRGLQRGIEAALDLAREYGVTLPDRDPDAQKKAEARRRVEDESAGTAKTCHLNLARHARVAVWWRGRGFSDELQKQFLLGANADGTSAVIPFWNRGRVQGLIRRQLEREPKYLLPAAEEFPEGHKPLFVVGPNAGEVHLVEGFVDALALAALGFRAVAVGGTGMSEHQKTELLRLKGTFHIHPDADDEGAKAGKAWAGELYPRAVLCPAEYGDGRKDVADLFAAEGEGAKAILEGLKGRAVDALGLALSSVPKGSSRERYCHFRGEVLPLLLRIEDEGERGAAADDAAKALGLKASDLRRAIKPQAEAEDAADDSLLVLDDPEPWAESVDGARLLDGMAAAVGRFLSASDEVFKAVALWAVYTFAYDLFDTSPLLAIVSPEKRCGKTTLLTLLQGLVPRHLSIANITAAALFRTVEKYRPTLLIDEADSFLTNNEELRGVLNSGHRRATAFVIRTVGDDHEPRRFTT